MDTVDWSHVKVATTYPRVAEAHFTQNSIQGEWLYLGGAVELAHLLGLCDYIVDLVETGPTLKDNGLVEVEEIMGSSARLVVNRASQKTNMSRLCNLFTTCELI